MPEEQGSLAILARLEAQGIITPVGLRIDDPDFPFVQWAAMGAYFGKMSSTLRFLLGDWLNFGSSGVYGEQYAQAMEVTGYAYETLTNYASVCRKVSWSRRRQDLTFSHHKLVAPLEPRAQDEWLAAALDNAWKRSDLETALKDSQAKTAVVLPPVVPPQPLSASSTAQAVGSLVAVRGALQEAERAGLSQAVPALRALDRAGATLKEAAAAPTLREVAIRVVDAATLNGAGYLVAREPLDELRGLVTTEGSTE